MTRITEQSIEAARCVACKQPIKNRSTYFPTESGPMHPLCWERGNTAAWPRHTGRHRGKAMSEREKMRNGLLRWAVQRWEAEVKNRPLQNIHRRTLDDTWRQVIRHLGGDDIMLCGPAHDELLAI